MSDPIYSNTRPSRQELKQRVINNSVYAEKPCSCKDKNITTFGIPFEPEKANLMKGYYNDLRELYRKHVNRPIRSYDIDVASDGYELAKNLLLDKPDTWLYIRSVNSVIDLNLSFVEDTQNYILYGDRTCSIDNWSFLIDWGEPKYSNRPPRRIESDGAMLSDPPPDMVSLWVKHENGLNDMLYTMYALFCGNPMRV